MVERNLDLSEASMPEWVERFPEPHTMPIGWNLDKIVPSLVPAVSEKSTYLFETNSAEQGVR
ncbi:MAG: hypothetical protein ACXWNQ_01750 [Anaerolineales bacterium]